MLKKRLPALFFLILIPASAAFFFEETLKHCMRYTKLGLNFYKRKSLQ